MSKPLQIHIPQHQPELEAAILHFIQDEFQQTTHFQNEPAPEIQHKDGGALDALWQVAVVIATLEGVLQFSDRVKRLERVKKLQEAIQRTGKPVYLRIKNKTINLYQQSADQIMNLLAGDEDGDDD